MESAIIDESHKIKGKERESGQEISLPTTIQSIVQI